MCDRWVNSFANFLEDMGKRPDPKMELDRIDNAGHYAPGNCRWVTAAENARNKHRACPIPKKVVVKKYPSPADQKRLRRIDAVRDRYQESIDKLLAEVQRYRDERDAVIMDINDRIRPEFQVTIEREGSDYPEHETERDIRVRVRADRRR